MLNFKNTKCQEIVSSFVDYEIKCGKQGSTVVWHEHDGQNVYVMCEACADHNIKNRGGIELTEKEG